MEADGLKLLNGLVCYAGRMHTFRPANEADQPAIIELITNVYHEYGEQMCLDNADKDLLDIEASYRGKGGEFVVCEMDGQIVGAHDKGS